MLYQNFLKLHFLGNFDSIWHTHISTIYVIRERREKERTTQLFGRSIISFPTPLLFATNAMNNGRTRGICCFYLSRLFRLFIDKEKKTFIENREKVKMHDKKNEKKVYWFSYTLRLWYSECCDIVNKTKLPFWGSTKQITLDIVNYSI